MAVAGERTSAFGAHAGDGEPLAAEREDPGSADVDISSALEWGTPGSVAYVAAWMWIQLLPVSC